MSRVGIARAFDSPSTVRRHAASVAAVALGVAFGVAATVLAARLAGLPAAARAVFPAAAAETGRDLRVGGLCFACLDGDLRACRRLPEPPSEARVLQDAAAVGKSAHPGVRR